MRLPRLPLGALALLASAVSVFSVRAAEIPVPRNNASETLMAMAPVFGGQNLLAGDGLAMVQLQNSGHLDAGYGASGLASTGLDAVHAVFADSFGNALVIGRRVVNGETHIVLRKFFPNGLADQWFGGDGYVPLFSGNGLQFVGAAQDAEGRIVVAVQQQDMVQLRRVHALGESDYSYGLGGLAQVAVPAYTQLTSMLLEPDGRVVLGGHNEGDALLWRVENNGLPDFGFGAGGFAQLSAGGIEKLYALTRQSSGRYLLAGSSDDNMMVMGVDATGQMDLSFGNGGYLLDRIADAADSARALVVLPDQRIAVAGNNFRGQEASPDFRSSISLWQLTADGQLDGSFGYYGHGLHYGESGSVTQLRVLDDGRWQIGGQVWRWYADESVPGDWFSDFSVWQFDGPWSLDSSFGPQQNGRAVIEMGHALDSDNDGIADSEDWDDDNDGVDDYADAFPLNAAESRDSDTDGIGDNADNDDDNDGVADGNDSFPLDPNETADFDTDGTGDNADTDDDNDGFADNEDAFPRNANEFADSDGDGTGDNSDSDDDNDGYADGNDAFPTNRNEWLDTDWDGLGNNADGDDDGDGLPDAYEAQYGLDPLDTQDAYTDRDGDTLQNVREYELGTNPTLIDSDGDGYVDIAEVRYGSDPAQAASKPAATYRVARDSNRDFAGDLLWRNSNSGALQLWLLNGTEALATHAVTGDADLNWQIAAVGDFDGDARADWLWRNKSTGANRLWTLQGFNPVTKKASATVASRTDLTWTIAGSGDFNGDGKADLFWRNTGTGSNSVWLMNGATYTGSWTPAKMATSWKLAAIADVSGDGKADLIWRSSTGTMQLRLSTGTGFGSAITLPSEISTTWQIAGNGDWDGDGKVDLVWSNASSGDNRVWLMQGSGVKAIQALERNTDSAQTIAAVVDVDGNNIVDLVWLNSVTAEVSLWRNPNGNNQVQKSVLGVLPDVTWKATP